MHENWYIELLGGLCARRADQLITRFPTRKTAALLAYLAYHPQRPTPRELLIELLWPECEPEAGRHRLAQALYSLRGPLEPPGIPRGSVLVADKSTMQLSSSCHTDVSEFETAVQAAKQSPSSTERRQRLEEAVALYQGELLPGHYEEWILPERQRLAEAYLESLHGLIGLAEAARDLRQALEWARRAIAADNLREESQHHLIRLLAAAGEGAAARRQYREWEQLLERELGAEPAPEIRALLDAVPAETRRLPDHPSALRRGSVPAAHAAAEPPPPDAAAPPSSAACAHLPQPLTRFFGREVEIQWLCELMRGGETRLVTLTGAGGCGKSRLALEAARRMIDDHPAGVWLVELAALSEPGLVPQRVASALGVQEAPGRAMTEILIDGLRQRGSLVLLLDNCEHLLPATAALAEALLQACPNLRILAASREALGVPGEQLCRVPSLRSPDRNDPPPLSRLVQYEAVQLFLDRARLVQPAFAVTAANADAIAELCWRLDGMPLALELAAARVKALPVEKLNERLADTFQVLTGGSRTHLPRHQTLEATIGWSYNLLTEPERTLQRRLAVFAGGWTLEAAEAVCSDSRPPGTTEPSGAEPVASIQDPRSKIQNEEVLDLLTALVDKSLVQYEEREREARYRLLETVRQYSRDQLLEAGEEEAVRQQHAAFFLALAEVAEPNLWRDAAWLDHLEIEHDNLRSALEWYAGGSSETGLRLAVALRWFWWIRGYRAEGRRRLEIALARNAPRGTPVQRNALCAAGHFAASLGDIGAATVLAEESLALCREAGDRPGMGWSLRVLAEVAWNQLDMERRIALGEECLAQFRETDDSRGLALALHQLGCALDGDRARALQVESLALCRQEGYRWLSGEILGVLGCSPFNAGQLERAEASYQESLAIHREFGNRAGAAFSLGCLARLADAVGDWVRALALAEESLAACRDCGDRRQCIDTLQMMGRYALAGGEHERARVYLEEALALSRALGGPRVIELVLFDLARVAHSQGDPAKAWTLFQEGLAVTHGMSVWPEQAHLLLELGDYAAARTCYEEVLALRRAGEDLHATPWGLLEIGHAAWLQGDYAGVGPPVVEALGVFRERQESDGMLAALESLAVAALAQGRKERAAQLMGAVESHREGLAWLGVEWWRQPRERIGQAVRAASLKQEFAAPWAEGRAMSLEEAAALASQTDPIP